MPRLFNMALIVAMILGAVVTYTFKYRAEAAADHLADLRRSVEEEKDRLNYLKAEWSVLTQPARLQELIEMHGEQLGLLPIDPNQIAGFSDIPPRPVPQAPEGEPAVATTGASPEHTGAIAQ